MKNITLFLMTLILAGPTYAKWGANCTSNGGTIVKANEYGTKDGVNLDKGGLCNDPSDPNATNNCNGMEFCMSGKNMNWWSAFTWCESVGGRLVDFQNACPSVPKKENKNYDSCPNLKNVYNSSYWCWVDMGWGASAALTVNLSDARIYSTGREAAGGHYALCEEK